MYVEWGGPKSTLIRGDQHVCGQSTLIRGDQFPYGAQ